MMNLEGITIKSGALPGKTLAVFAGIHGNEKVGVLALDKIVDNLVVECGTVYFVYANPKAIERNVREVDRNLNRLFIRNLNDSSWEYSRANELMDVLDKADALLDVHASNSKNTKPFLISNESGMSLAKKFDVGIVSFGWDRLVPGSTDTYMSRQNKIGLCLECGSVFETEKNLPLAIGSIHRFLQELGAISTLPVANNHEQMKVEVFKTIIKETESFRFTDEFDDFDKLREGNLYALDGDKKYIAGRDECILFPRPNKPIGGEAALIGRIVK